MRSVVRASARGAAMLATRGLTRIAGPARVSQWAVAGAPERGEAARSVIVEVSSHLEPTPLDILANYARGGVLFGRASEPGAVAWVRYPERAVIDRASAHVPKRVRTYQRRGEYELRWDADTGAIIRACQEGRNTWLTDRAVDLYEEVARLGFLSALGAYRDGELIAGLWGLSVGRTFGLMSMFHREQGAGAIALAHLVDLVAEGERWDLLDCGLLNENFARYGAYSIPVGTFAERVAAGLRDPGPVAVLEVPGVGSPDAKVAISAALPHPRLAEEPSA